MIKIIHWIPAANLGGCEVLLSTFLEGSIESADHTILVGEEGPAIEMWMNKGVDSIRIVDFWWSRNPFKWARNIKEILSGHDDFYFIAWSPSRLPFLRWALGFTSFKGIIVHIGSLVSTPPIRNLLYRFIDNLLRNKNKNITLVACSDYVAKSVKVDSYYKKFESIGVLNGIRGVFFTHDVRRIGLNQWRFCTVSRLDAVKGHLGMIENIVSLHQKQSKVTFDIIGEGDMRGQLLSAISRYNSGDYVRLLGNRTEVIDLLDSHDFFIFNSQSLEGMGIALAEAMSRGLICIVNDTPLMHEMLGECGLYFKTKEEFVNVLLSLSPSSLSDLSTKTRLRAKEMFEPHIFSKTYINLLEKNESC